MLFFYKKTMKAVAKVSQLNTLNRNCVWFQYDLSYVKYLSTFTSTFPLFELNRRWWFENKYMIVIKFGNVLLISCKDGLGLKFFIHQIVAFKIKFLHKIFPSFQRPLAFDNSFVNKVFRKKTYL